MYPWIVCFNCGKAIGDLYDAFKAMKLAKYKEVLGEDDFESIDPALFAITEDIQIELTDIFDQLGLELMCCRAHIHTQVEFTELY